MLSDQVIWLSTKDSLLLSLMVRLCRKVGRRVELKLAKDLASADGTTENLSPTLVIIDLRTGASGWAEQEWHDLGRFLHSDCGSPRALIYQSQREIAQYTGLNNSVFVPVDKGIDVLESFIVLTMAGFIHLQKTEGHPTGTQLSGQSTSITSIAANRRKDISTREHQVLVGLSFGRSNKEIARELALSEASIKSYIGQMNRRFGCRNRTELLLRGQSLGYI